MVSPLPAWVERATERSPTVQSSRTRSAQRATEIVEAAKRLIMEKGADFTTQELVREAGVAVQTFYNHFAGKDQLLLAAIEDMITDACAHFEELAKKHKDPLKRLRFYILAIVGALGVGADGPGAKFMTAEHWRLSRLYPEEMARATQPFTDLLVPEIAAATEAGLLNPPHPDYDAWLISQLLMAVFHFHSYSPIQEPAPVLVDRVWAFCLGALGGTVPEPTPKRRTKKA